MRAQLLFFVNERRETDQGPQNQKVGSLKLTPRSVMDDHPLAKEIKSFYAWTPGGQIDFSTVNEAVLESFPPGTACSVSIEPWEPDPNIVILDGELLIGKEVTWMPQSGAKYRGTVYDIRNNIAFVAVLGYGFMFRLPVPTTEA